MLLEFISSGPLMSRCWTGNTCATGGVLRDDTGMKEQRNKHEHQYQHGATAGSCRTVVTVGIGQVAISDDIITVSSTSLSSERLCWLICSRKNNVIFLLT